MIVLVLAFIPIGFVILGVIITVLDRLAGPVNIGRHHEP